MYFSRAQAAGGKHNYLRFLSSYMFFYYNLKKYMVKFNKSLNIDIL